MIQPLKWVLPFFLMLTAAQASEIESKDVNPREGMNSANLEQEKLSIRKSQVHVRVGLLMGAYSGTFEGEFQVPAAFDLDYELFMTNDSSILFRFIQGLDDPDSIPFYTYAGLGYRYYWNSKGPLTVQKGDGLFIESIPRLRYYIGFDIGVAQVLVKSFGPNVQSVANMADAGLGVGAIYQLNKDFGLEGHLGASYGYGISSTPVNGNTQRATFGMSYYF